MSLLPTSRRIQSRISRITNFGKTYIKDDLLSSNSNNSNSNNSNSNNIDNVTFTKAEEREMLKELNQIEKDIEMSSKPSTFRNIKGGNIKKIKK